MMKTKKIEKTQWESYFDSITNFLKGKVATIDVTSLDIGDQLQANEVALFGLTYDPKNDLFEVSLEGLDHLILQPKEIYVLNGEDGIEAIEIVTNKGVKQVITLKQALMLPA